MVWGRYSVVIHEVQKDMLIFVYLEQIGPLLVRDVLDVVQVDVGQLGVVVGRLLDHLVDVCTVRRLLGEDLAVVCNVEKV